MTTTQKKANPFLAVRAAHKAGSREADEESTSAPEHESTSAQSNPNIVRKPSGQRLRTDLLREYKVLAAQEGKPLYMVMEEALEEYLAKRRAAG
jgi:hypothetical protein